MPIPRWLPPRRAAVTTRAAGDQTTLAAYRDAADGIHLSHVIEHLWGDDAQRAPHSGRSS